MPIQVYQVLGLYLLTTIVYIAWIMKSNRDIDNKLAKRGPE
ncbi:hypothetical protein ACFL0D_04995 [Thermoproteota archaeon]